MLRVIGQTRTHSVYKDRVFSQQSSKGILIAQFCLASKKSSRESILSVLTPQLDLYVTSELKELDVTLLQGKLPMEYEHDNDGRDYHHGRCSSK